MSAVVVDQRDIQRRGGKCARYPVSCLIHSLLVEAGLEPRDLTVLDLTYGQGRFYAAWRPRVLIGADIHVHNWVVMPDLFVKAPAWVAWRKIKKVDMRPDIVVVDPPWVERGSSKRRLYGLDLALGTPQIILEAGVKASKELGTRYLLIHFKDRWVPRGWYTIAETRFLYVTRYNEQNGTTWFGILTPTPTVGSEVRE